MLGRSRSSLACPPIIEKITYARALAGYRTLVQKLVHRVERLEGVTLTPDYGHPSESARPALAWPRRCTAGPRSPVCW